MNQYIKVPALLEQAKLFIIDGLANGKLKPSVGTIFSLESIEDAYQRVQKNSGLGKIVIRP